MDFNSTKLLPGVKIDADKDSIYYLYDYYQHKESYDASDKRRDFTSSFLNFKRGRKDTYRFFIPKLREHFNDFSGSKWLVCSIPGHDQTQPISNNMDIFLEDINLPDNILLIPGLIVRTEAMPEKHLPTYGRRTIERDLKSFTLGTGLNIKGKNIIVFDDITTSGSSLMAARKFLKSLGAAKVVTIALGRTVERYGKQRIDNLF